MALNKVKNLFRLNQAIFIILLFLFYNHLYLFLDPFLIGESIITTTWRWWFVSQHCIKQSSNKNYWQFFSSVLMGFFSKSRPLNPWLWKLWPWLACAKQIQQPKVVKDSTWFKCNNYFNWFFYLNYLFNFNHLFFLERLFLPFLPFVALMLEKSFSLTDLVRQSAQIEG